MFARGTGKDHWEDVMKNQKTHIQKWHKLQDVVCESSRESNSLDIPEVRNAHSEWVQPGIGGALPR